jgi:3'-5' exoribonuclease
MSTACGHPDRCAEWLGIREPVSLEATILSAADRLSGQADLVSRMAPEEAGFGGYHKHLKGRPYVVGEVEWGQTAALVN